MSRPPREPEVRRYFRRQLTLPSHDKGLWPPQTEADLCWSPKQLPFWATQASNSRSGEHLGTPTSEMDPNPNIFKSPKCW